MKWFYAAINPAKGLYINLLIYRTDSETQETTASYIGTIRLDAYEKSKITYKQQTLD